MNTSCPFCNGAMWDNRQNKKNPRAPDYKCKDDKKAGCEGAIWPNGSFSNTGKTQPKPWEQRSEPVKQDQQSEDKPQGGAPDWDNIALGKCRTLFAIEAFKAGKTLDQATINNIERWALYCLKGTL